MNQPAFIRIEKTKDAAMYYRNSPQMAIYSFEGIQLLPNDLQPYVQQTNADGGIVGDIILVQLYNTCDELLANITSSFSFLESFVDPLTGFPQFRWQLQNVPYDANGQLVYMRLVTVGGEIYYSSPFSLTNYESEYTSRWDYRNRTTDQMLSIRLQIWFKFYDMFQELASYDTITTRSRFSIINKTIPYEVWGSKVVEYSLFMLFKEMTRNRFIYLDLQRFMLFDGFDNPRPEGRENFGEVVEILLTRDKNDTYTPPSLDMINWSTTYENFSTTEYNFSLIT